MKSTKNPRNSKRVMGLGLLALSMSLVGGVARADNLTAANAVNVPPNSGVSNCVAVLGQTKYFMTALAAGRSYVIDAGPIGFRKGYPPGTTWAATGDGTGGNFSQGIQVSTNDSFTALVSIANSFATPPEGSMISAEYGVANSTRFTTTATGTHFIKMPTFYSAGCFYISVRETTLFSPWLSRAAGFEGFIELHNNTIAPVSVTLRGHDSTGTLQGAGLTFSIPANATVFKTGADIGVPAGVAVGITLTHTGAFGAISGNITTLNGAVGLSFDSPFTPRTDSIRMH